MNTGCRGCWGSWCRMVPLWLSLLLLLLHVIFWCRRGIVVRLAVLLMLGSGGSSSGGALSARHVVTVTFDFCRCSRRGRGPVSCRGGVAIFIPGGSSSTICSGCSRIGLNGWLILLLLLLLLLMMGVVMVRLLGRLSYAVRTAGQVSFHTRGHITLVSIGGHSSANSL